MSTAHMTHCNQGEYAGMCKYGEADCPVLAKALASSVATRGATPVTAPDARRRAEP